MFTVKDLRKALKGVKGDVEVTILLPDKVRSNEDYMRYVKSARFHGPGPISNKEFKITAGEGFGY